MKKNKSPRSGFTLIELLTVIAIIGILAGILIPAVGKVRSVANKATSSNNMRSIAVSYATYSTSGGRVRTLTQAKLNTDGPLGSVAGVAQFLAKHADLTDAAIWIIASDPAVTEYNAELPAIIGYRDDSNAFQTSSEWTASVPVGYDFAIGVNSNSPASTTPLLWTRALTTSGTWGKDSPWGLGGHIAFLDGHVQFYNELGSEDGQLVNPSNGALTTSITDIHPAENIMTAPNFSN